MACLRSSWWTCRKRSVAFFLASRFKAETAARPRRAPPRELDLALVPHLAPAFCVDARADHGEPVVGFECLALGRREQVADVVADRLADAEKGEELQVQPDLHEPARIGQVLPPRPCPAPARG